MAINKPKKLTPMLIQYYTIKEQNQDSLLFFRLGDFYELFGEDAVVAHKILGITLTARNKGTENEIPMCGVPHHSSENYIAKLIRAGKKVAICEQVSDPSEKGIVERKVVRIITPGTTLQESILEEKQNNFLLAFVERKNQCGVAYCDLSTGEMKATEIHNTKEAFEEIARVSPAEIILDSENIVFTELHSITPNISLYNESDDAKKTLQEHFSLQDISVFGLESKALGLQAASNLLSYLKTTQKTQLDQIQKISSYTIHDYMMLDTQTLRNLEILWGGMFGQEKEGSLIGILDQTCCAPGARLLRKWITQPLLNKEDILKRQELVQLFFQKENIQTEIRDILNASYDMERLISRLASQRGNARDLKFLAKTIQSIQPIEDILTTIDHPSEYLQQILSSFKKELFVLGEKYNNILQDELPLTIQEGWLFKEGYNDELDRLRNIQTNGNTWLENYTKQIKESSEITNLRIKYTDNTGYFIEVSRANGNNVPASWRHKQTLVNAMRFTNDELDSFQNEYLSCSESICTLEYTLFQQLRTELNQHIQDIQKLSASIAQIDVLCSFAFLTKKQGYIFPAITEENSIQIQNARHPISETIETHFIANDIQIEPDNRVKLITGPNMAGKSTYLRTAGLCVLLTQIGCSIPADQASLSICDRIFTRVWAQDNLNKGQSTFMVEMQETAHILNHATEKSLILLDEIGRGTSTYDGLAIARSVLDYLHDTTKAKTLFATHYHELANHVEELTQAQNLSVSILEQEDGIVFLHKVVHGKAGKSFGIAVAERAGLPKEILYQAQKHLQYLENQEKKWTHTSPKQEALFTIKTPEEKELESDAQKYKELSQTIIPDIQELDISNTTPIQALSILESIQKNIKSL